MFVTSLLIVFGAGTAHAEPYSETLQRETGLRAGFYKLAPGTPENCLSGVLQIVDVAPQAVSIMIETTELIDAIGPDSDSPEVRKGDLCPDVRRPYTPGSIRAGLIEGKKIMKCPQRTATWAYKIEIDPQGLTYTIDRGTQTETCKLIKRRR